MEKKLATAHKKRIFRAFSCFLVAWKFLYCYNCIFHKLFAVGRMHRSLPRMLSSSRMEMLPVVFTNLL